MKTFFARLFIPLVSVLLLASCVSNKQYQYLQKDDVNKNRNELPKDKVIRTYALDTFNYKIQPQDMLYVRFRSMTSEEFDFFNSANGNVAVNPASLQVLGDLVDENGEIPFPGIGKVKVTGLTVFQIQDKLQKLADQYLEAPIVKVRLVNYRITVLGEVKQQMTVTLSNNRVNMLEAIAMAGGLGELADRSNVKLIRQKGGITEVQYLNLLDENFMSSPYYYVNQNDVLIVPPLKQRPFRMYFGQNLALVASALTLLLLSYNLTK